MHCSERMPHASQRAARRGFTLVELLVVIGIIAVLISILLPALGNARRSANTAKCAANLRSIVQGMNLYAAQWKGAIPGSPWTSARFVDPANMTGTTMQGLIGQFNGVFSITDYMSPIAKVLGVKFNEGGTEADRLQRFEQLRNNPIFRCPDNEFLAVKWSGSTGSTGQSLNVPVGPMISYNTSFPFMVRGVGSGYQQIRSRGRPEWAPPASYNNTIADIGQASRKVYIADGGKFSTGNVAPDIDPAVDGTNGGVFSDQPPVTGGTQSWGRSRTPANRVFSTGTVDERIYAYRHGKIVRDGRGDTGFKINLGFFDGHVETLGDLEASNPVFWYPKGTELTNLTGQFTSQGTPRPQVYPDVRARYMPGVTGTYVVP